MVGPFQRIRRRGDEGPAAPVAQPETPAAEQHAAPAAEHVAASPQAAAVPAGSEPADPLRATRPSFLDRGRLRRRLRYLRRVRELGFRDLGGLVFDQHRFRAQRPDLVQGKLHALEAVDRELRALERALGDRREFIDLREPGIAACPRCSALHGSDARFCPSCGLRLSGPRSFAEVAEGPQVVDPASGVVQPPPPPPPEPAMAERPVGADQATAALPAVGTATVTPGDAGARADDAQEQLPEAEQATQVIRPGESSAANGDGAGEAVTDPSRRDA
jgi:hypothetical protein